MAFEFTIRKVVVYDKSEFDFMDIKDVVSNKYVLP